MTRFQKAHRKLQRKVRRLLRRMRGDGVLVIMLQRSLEGGAFDVHITSGATRDDAEDFLVPIAEAIVKGIEQGKGSIFNRVIH